VAPSLAWAQLRAGSEFQVNIYTTSSQRFTQFPSVAVDGNGDFVVVWDSYGQDGSRYGIAGRRFSASGAPKAGEFLVNAYSANDQDAAAVASDGAGNFIVVWEGAGPGDDDGVFRQLFDANGAPQGSETRVNSYTIGPQRSPAVAEGADGSLVIAWTDFGQDGESGGIFLQGLGDLQVNSYTTGQQSRPAVAMDGAGNFVVVWQSLGQDGSGWGIFGQRFNAFRFPQGNEFRVNTYTSGNQQLPSVAADADGNFVVVWESIGVVGQRFNAAGVPEGPELQIAAGGSPRVAAVANGGFVVVWTDDDGSTYGVSGRRFDASGTPVGSAFRVNSYTTRSQISPAVASSPDGDFVVAWSSLGQAGSGYSTFGQRYGDLIFEDGFESGDLSRWSSASTGGGDLLVSGAAALAGTPAGLLAFVNDTTSLYVQHDTPASFSRYRARFYFDPNGFDPGEASSHFRVRIFLAQDASNQRLVTIVLKRQAGQYSVAARARLNDGTRVDTAFFNITNAQHFVEFDWQRATGPGTSDGYLGLLIDGTTVAVLTALDNDLSPVSFVRMGAVAVKTGAAGTLFFDQFESRTLRLIGPE
jgi:hypothetical protein